MLRVRFTLPPGLSLVRGLGFCEITFPFFTLEEKLLLTRPTEQCAFLSARLAAASVLPFTFGTMQRALKVAFAEWFTLIASVQEPVPEQSPDQPTNFDFDEAEAVSFTEVPCA